MSIWEAVNPLEAALGYAARGWKVFPVHYLLPWGGVCSCGKQDCSKKNRGKHPATPRGFKDATTDRNTILSWWDRDHYNVGIATGAESGIVVLDVDAASGGYTFPGLEGLEAPCVQTGGGGKHYYFRHPGAPVPNSAGKLWAGIDVRGDGGYVVAPPSNHYSGESYLWFDMENPDAVPLPVWPFQSDQGGDWSSLNEGKLQEGEGRNNALARHTGILISQGLAGDALFSEALTYNRLNFAPPLPLAEVRKTVNSVWSTHLRNQQATAQKNLLEVASRPAPPTPTLGEVPESLLVLDGIQGELQQYLLSRMVRPQPLFATAASFALLGVVLGRRVQGWTGVRTAQYHLAVGPTGCGKDAPRSGIKSVLAAAGLLDLLCGEEVSSDTAILDRMYDQPASIFLLDEFGRTIEKLQGGKAPAYLAGITSTLMKLYSSTADVFLGKQYGVGVGGPLRERRDIDQPCPVIYATTVPGRLWGSLSRNDVEDGFLPRFLLWSTKERPRRVDVDPTLAVPTKVVDAVRRAAHLPLAPGIEAIPGNLSAAGIVRPNPRVVPLDPGAREVFAAYDEAIYLEMDREDGLDTGCSGLWARAWEHSAKLAVILASGRALGENRPFAPTISQADAEKSVALADALIRRMVQDVKAYVTASVPEQELAAVRRGLARYPQGATRGDLHNAVPSLRKARLLEALEILIARGEAIQVAKELVVDGKKPRLLNGWALVNGEAGSNWSTPEV